MASKHRERHRGDMELFGQLDNKQTNGLKRAIPKVAIATEKYWIIGYLNKITAQCINSIHSNGGEAKLQTGHKILLKIGIKRRYLNTDQCVKNLKKFTEIIYLFWIDFTNKSNGFEILKAQVWKLEKFSRHQRHDDVETIETNIRCCHILRSVTWSIGGR